MRTHMHTKSEQNYASECTKTAVWTNLSKHWAIIISCMPAANTLRMHTRVSHSHAWVRLLHLLHAYSICCTLTTFAISFQCDHFWYIYRQSIHPCFASCFQHAYSTCYQFLMWLHTCETSMHPSYAPYLGMCPRRNATSRIRCCASVPPLAPAYTYIHTYIHTYIQKISEDLVYEAHAGAWLWACRFGT